VSTEQMSRRERITAAIRGEDVDRLPWSPLLDGYFLGSQVDQLTAFRRIRADAMIRNVINCVGSAPMATAVPPPGKSLPFTLSTNMVGEEAEISYETPVGTVTERFLMNEQSPNIPWVTKNKVQTVEDLKVLRWMYEHAEFATAPEMFESMDEQVGDDGITTVSALGTPLFWMLNFDVGVGNFWYLYSDHIDEVEQTIEAAHQMYLRFFRTVAEGPGEVVIQYENLSSSLCSPTVWEKYSFHHANDYADILHDAGKIFLQHSCGHLAAFGTKIGQMHLDGCVDVATPPTGTITFSLARELWGPDKLIMGGIDATHYVGDTPEQMKQHVRELIADMGTGRRMILGSGDATPKGTPWENLIAVSEVIEEEADFPLNS